MTQGRPIILALIGTGMAAVLLVPFVLRDHATAGQKTPAAVTSMVVPKSVMFQPNCGSAAPLSSTAS